MCALFDFAVVVVVIVFPIIMRSMDRDFAIISHWMCFVFVTPFSLFKETVAHRNK